MSDSQTQVQSEGSGPEVMPLLFDTVLILDFGSQYSHLITRRLRELNIYAEMLPCTQKLKDLGWNPKAIILSGGPYSVYAPDAPHVDAAVFEMGVPILGICYGMQEMAWHHGKNVAAGEKREYGLSIVKIRNVLDGSGHVNALFEGIEGDMEVWMSHGDKLSALPENFVTIGATANAPWAGIAHLLQPFYGIQFHPEVTHTPLGTQILKNFAVKIAQCRQHWTMEEFVTKEIKRIQTTVGPTGHVIGAVSGGVDSTVAAKIMQEAIGDRFHAVLVDNGVMRLNECLEVQRTLRDSLGINLKLVDASDEFLGKLKGVEDPERKRKIIGNTFIEVFQREAENITKEAGHAIDYLLQGTLYPDVIESISFKGPSQTIKTHHNVGGLLENMRLKLIEPLRELFKDEVRHLGTLLQISEELVWRHPFPGPGIAIRILGEITPSQIDIARRADHIFIQEIRSEGIYRKISQAFAALIPVRAVGVMGDQRQYEQIIALRAVTTTDFMTADWYEFSGAFIKRVSNRIVNEVPGVCRVLYDVTQKPPGTIEFL